MTYYQIMKGNAQGPSNIANSTENMKVLGILKKSAICLISQKWGTLKQIRMY